MSSDWRENHRSQHSKLEYMIDNNCEEFGDTIIIVGRGEEKQTLHVISVFIEINSKKLTTLLETNGGSLQLEDEDPQDFRMLLKVMYTGKWSTKLEDAIPLLVIARNVEADLVDQQVTHWLKNTGINVETAIKIYQMSAQRCPQLKDLEESSWNYILENGMDICKNSTFNSLSEDHVIKLAKDNDLMIDDEIIIVDAVKGWGEAKGIGRQQNLAETVQQIVPHLRLYFLKEADIASTFRLLKADEHAHLDKALKDDRIKRDILKNPADAKFNTVRRRLYKVSQ